jgi:transposase
MEALKAKPKGPRKSPAILTEEEQQRIAKAIRSHTPKYFGLPFSKWSRKAVVALIEQQLHKKIAIRTAGSYLARWGDTAKKARRNAYEKDPEEKQRFLHHRYPAIAHSARENGAILVWPDETGFRSTDSRGKGYAPRGSAAQEDASGKRFGCNVISAITADGRAVSLEFTGSFTAQVFIAFLEMLIDHFHRRMIYLMMDAHPVHLSEEVEEWLFEHKDKIKAFLLPGYCPELNPLECMNNDAKAQINAGVKPHSLTELETKVCNVLREIINDTARVKSYFRNVDALYILG